MRYRVNYHEGVIEFVKNKGQAFLEATSSDEALALTRELFDHIREGYVQRVADGQYLVNFLVSLDYRMPLLKMIDKAAKLLRTRKLYDAGRCLDRYMVATIFKETGKPEFLAEVDIAEEIRTMRRAAVVARETPNIISFIDYDICIYNYLELNNKEGFKSRVVRKVAP